jgi:solute carrier family 38 (sodium-coupled neutral amino acid transporter), member 11
MTTTTGNPRTFQRQVSTIDIPIVKVGIFGSSSNLVNAIVGAGIIGIPYSIKQSGFVIGVLLIVLVGVLTDKSLRIIINLATYHPKLHNIGVLTYEDLMRIPFGDVGKNFVLINMLILAYGAMVAYLLIIKDTVPTVMGLGNSFVEREVVMLLSSLFIMVPLSMMRDISQLSMTSTISVIADVFLMLIVVIYSPFVTTIKENGGIGEIIANNWVKSNLFVGLGVISTAMACQHSAFLISGTLENHTPRRWGMITSSSLSVATALSLLLGVFGYLGFLGDTQGDILLNFEAKGSIVVDAGRSLLAITMFLTYPMESFVARHVIVQLLYNGNMDNTTIGMNGEQVPEAKIFGYFGRREKLTFGLYLSTLIPALFLKDLGPVLSITGSIGASCIAYMAPGLVYIGINGSDFIKWGTGSTMSETHQTVEIELPVVGDATATLEKQEGQTSGSNSYQCSLCHYICLMPLWLKIAKIGEENTHLFPTGLESDGAHSDFMQNSNDITNTSHNNDNLNNEYRPITLGPNVGDFRYSMFFIVFGTIAAVAGVGTNIYVQVNNVFFTPH